MKTKLFLLMAIVLFACSTAKAYDAEIDGIYYNFNGDEAEVTYKDISRNSYTGDIVIPESVVYNAKTYSVTSIGSSAFAVCYGLTSVNIPNSVTSIGDHAFFDCPGLTSITIPNSVTSIGWGVFEECYGLTSVTIGNSVTSIGDEAFFSCSGLTSVTIPNSVTSIGYNAFRDCSGLTSVTIGNSVTSIGESAFSGCSALTSVTLNSNALVSKSYSWDSTLGDVFGQQVKTYILGDEVTSIGSYAFCNCTSLASVTIPNSVTSIGEETFADCSGLTSVTIGNSVTSIGFGVFSGCSGLTSVIIPNSVTSIGDLAFSRCSGLTSVTIPNSVTSIGNCAFQCCSGLTSVTIGNSVISIWHAVFEGCSSLTSVTIPNSVTSIEGDAFNGCSGLTSIEVESGNRTYDSRNNCNAIIETATNTLIQGCKNTTIPNSVTSIGWGAFYGCSGLTSVNIPNSVTSIENYAFAVCSGLTSVNIGNSVKSIEYHAFASCKELTDVYCLAENVPETSNDSFDDTPLNYATLHVPYGCKAAYEAASSWNEFGTIVEMEPESPIISFADAKVKALCVANWDTNNDGELDEVEAAAVTDLGTVFKGNTEITSFNELKYFAELTTIGIDAFYGCSHLASIAIPSSLTMVRKGAFKDCQSLSKVIVSDIAALCGIIYDGDDYNGDFPLGIAHHLYSDEDTEITELVIPEGVTKIEARAFRDAQYITSVTIPNSVTTIEAEAFRGMHRLTSINIPDGVTSLEPYTFQDCQSLMSINIPNSVTEIGDEAFCAMSKLTSVNIPNNVRTIGDKAFYGCNGLTSVSIGSGVVSIGSEAFRNCHGNFNLTSFTVADDNIYYDSRNNCNAIIETASDKLIWGCMNTIIPQGIKSIGKFSLQGCEFTSIDIPSSVTSIEADAMSHCPNLTSIDIPAGVSKIEAFTFYGCKSLTSVTMSKSVTSIGNFAFEGCTGLTDIYCYAEDIPNVAAFAFYNLSIDHTTLHVPYGCKAAYEAVSPWNEFGTIVEMEPESPIISFADAKVKALCVANWDTNSDGELNEAEAAAVNDLGIVFKENTEITSFNELQYFTGLTSIAEGAFYSCVYLTSVSIPNNVTSIEKSAFHDCWSLPSFDIPNSVTNIGPDAFYGCSYLFDIAIPNSVTQIEAGAFGNCTRLCRVTIPNSVINIGSYAFHGCRSLTSIAIPNSMTSIEEGVFMNCQYLESVTIPNSIKCIGKGAFQNCEMLNYIFLPNSVASIGDYAFDGCCLYSITIPNSVTSIGEKAFARCCIEEFYCFSEDIPLTRTNVFENSSIDSAILHVPNGCSNKYNAVFPWSEFNLMGEIGGSTISFSDAKVKALCVAHWDANGDGEVDEAEASAVRDLGEVFKNNTKITSFNELQYFERLGIIYEYAFYGCSSLASIAIPRFLYRIRKGAFRDCQSLSKVIVSDIAAWCGIIYEGDDYNGDFPLGIAHHLYSDEDTEITELVIPEGVRKINTRAFRDAQYITSVTIPNSVTTIEAEAFRGMTRLTSINIPENITSIEQATFFDCKSLTSIKIPNGVTKIGDDAFEGCNSLNDVYCWANNVPATNNNVFGNSPIELATLHVPYESIVAYKKTTPWSEFKEIVGLSSPITVGETGFSTFCSPHALDFSEVEDIRAYIVSGFNQETGTLVLTRVTEVPAGEGLYIAGMPGNHEIPQTKTSMFYANLLKGVTEPTIISPTDGNYTNYILSNGSYGVGFYTLSQTGTLDAGKAYLQLPTASVAGIKALKIEFDENDDPTGIAITSNTSAEENTIYNLAGQRVSKAHRGINIVNGKKVFIK